MASPRRRTQPEDRRGRVRQAGAKRPSGFRIPWTRRLGALAALSLLGASLVMAANDATGGRDRPTASAPTGASAGAPASTGTRSTAPSTPQTGSGAAPRPSSTAADRPVGPTLSLPETTWTRTTRFDVPGVLPDGWARRGTQRLRIFVDGRLARQVVVPASASFVVRAIPLKVGRHTIHATLRGPAGDTRPSATVTVIVDQAPPVLTIDRPVEGETVNAEQATFEGTLAGGQEITVRNDTTSALGAGAPAADGGFSLVVPLAAGVNTFTIRGTDHAGNAVTRQLRVVRGETRPTASLRLSAVRVRLTRLPVRMTIRVTVRDAARQPVTSAQVTFTVSPPGLPTLTYRAETASDGTAAWEGVLLTREGAIAGNGFATAFVELPDGGTLQETAPFRFE